MYIYGHTAYCIDVLGSRRTVHPRTRQLPFTFIVLHLRSQIALTLPGVSFILFQLHASIVYSISLSCYAGRIQCWDSPMSTFGPFLCLLLKPTPRFVLLYCRNEKKNIYILPTLLYCYTCLIYTTITLELIHIWLKYIVIKMDGSKVYANDYGYGYFWTSMYPYYNFLRYEGLFWGMPMYGAYVFLTSRCIRHRGR